MPNRTICAVLDEIRDCYKTRNFSYLPGLIEEAQSMSNRMESALWDQKDAKRLREEVKELRQEVKDLKSAKKALGSDDNDIIRHLNYP
jgi:polyhydroxyalkanoate synthesis regulator phasin